MSESFRIQDIPQQPQRQDALMDQLLDLMDVAIRLGMYDAADWISKHYPWHVKLRRKWQEALLEQRENEARSA